MVPTTVLASILMAHLVPPPAVMDEMGQGAIPSPMSFVEIADSNGGSNSSSSSSSNNRSSSSSNSNSGSNSSSHSSNNHSSSSSGNASGSAGGNNDSSGGSSSGNASGSAGGNNGSSGGNSSGSVSGSAGGNPPLVVFSVQTTSNVTVEIAVDSPCADALETLRAARLRQQQSAVLQRFLVFTLAKAGTGHGAAILVCAPEGTTPPTTPTPTTPQ